MGNLTTPLYIVDTRIACRPSHRVKSRRVIVSNLHRRHVIIAAVLSSLCQVSLVILQPLAGANRDYVFYESFWVVQSTIENTVARL